MDLIGDYDSSHSDDEDVANKSMRVSVAKRPDRRFLQAAPAISVMTRRNHANELIVRGESDLNSTTDNALMEPVQGPQGIDPASRRNKNQLVPGGETEANFQCDESNFSKQRTTFQRTGQAVGPNQSDVVVRTTLGYTSKRLELFQQKDEERRKRKREMSSGSGKEEPLVYGSDDEAVYGVWGPPTKEEQARAEDSLTDVQRLGVDALAPEQLSERAYLTERDRQLGIQQEQEEEVSAFDRLIERKMAHLLPPKIGNDDQPIEPKTTFHGKESFDYKGRSWMAPPSGLASIASSTEPLDPTHHRCFVPKKCTHRLTGHNKGVHRIRFFPKTGHLLLSGGLDGKCKVWSVETRQVMRTYEGHSAAVRDVQFNHSGSKFVSASFDRYLRLWDTETGNVLQTFCNRKVPYVVQFYPHDDNLFVVGCSDNKIITYDATTAEITQEYNHHLAPVNAIVFVEDHGTKMVTSSDDRKVLVWEWDIGVPIKYISDPTMHSMPCMTMHPSAQFFCAQSLDNHIAVFQAGNRFALQRKKKFTGHQVAGYSCDMAISPDGQFLVSGDGNGKIYFWEWKRQKMLQKYKAHDKGPAIACAWHPLEPSLLATCGWDGVIKLWE